jgi:hypothetical protein
MPVNTGVDSLIRQVRSNLKEPIARYWTDQELLDYMNTGAQDLWRHIVDLYEHHFSRIVTTPILMANSSVIIGVPVDCYRVVLIEPWVIGPSSSNPGLIFKPMNWTDPRFQQARAAGTVPARHNLIYYDLFGPGGPNDVPAIRVGPQVESNVGIALTYNYTLPRFDETGFNPIPGMADNALIAWTTAYARAKERPDSAPDPVWLSIYATEKTGLIKSIPPRQIQEPDVVLGMFEGYGDMWGTL